MIDKAKNCKNSNLGQYIISLTVLRIGVTECALLLICNKGQIINFPMFPGSWETLYNRTVKTLIKVSPTYPRWPLQDQI